MGKRGPKLGQGGRPRNNLTLEEVRRQNLERQRRYLKRKKKERGRINAEVERAS